jgi:hypothetical protein
MHCSIPKRPALRVEVEYLPRRLRVVVRDNGRGIDPQAAQTRSDAHWGWQECAIERRVLERTSRSGADDSSGGQNMSLLRQ